MSEQLAPETHAKNENPEEPKDSFAPSFDSVEPEASLGEQVKRRRTAKVDSVLAEAKNVALEAIQEIAPADSIGSEHHLRPEEERLTTHLFECTLPGYRGWFWFASLSRAPRTKTVTVCEIGLLPGDDALLAPAWVPWADRVQEGDEELETDELISDAEDVEDLTADSETTESEEDSQSEADQ